jgi:hypothetical protein
VSGAFDALPPEARQLLRVRGSRGGSRRCRLRSRAFAQIRFGELTGERKLRQPRLCCLRDDKRARDVVLERLAR